MTLSNKLIEPESNKYMNHYYLRLISSTFWANTSTSPQCFAGNDSKSCDNSALSPELFELTWQMNQIPMVLSSFLWTRHSAIAWTPLRLGVNIGKSRTNVEDRMGEWVGLSSHRKRQRSDGTSAYTEYRPSKSRSRWRWNKNVEAKEHRKW